MTFYHAEHWNPICVFRDRFEGDSINWYMVDRKFRMRNCLWLDRYSKKLTLNKWAHPLSFTSLSLSTAKNKATFLTPLRSLYSLTWEYYGSFIIFLRQLPSDFVETMCRPASSSNSQEWKARTESRYQVNVKTICQSSHKCTCHKQWPIVFCFVLSLLITQSTER